VAFKFWKILKNVSEVTLVTNNIFFLKILNFVVSFVECKVSLADGNFTKRWSRRFIQDDTSRGVVGKRGFPVVENGGPFRRVRPKR
jgi:hypothetical protein